MSCEESSDRKVTIMINHSNDLKASLITGKIYVKRGLKEKERQEIVFQK